VAAWRLVDPPEPVAWRGATVRRGRGPERSIVRAEGPHRLAGEFWDVPFDRSYHWLTLADGALWWIFRNERTGECFVQAVVD
jgi:hypothetical protein